MTNKIVSILTVIVLMCLFVVPISASGYELKSVSTLSNRGIIRVDLNGLFNRSMLDAPTKFTATFVGSDLVLTWVKDPTSTNTIIRRSYTAYPKSITEGAEIYNGTGTTFTITNVNGQSPQSFFSAFSESGGVYSSLYVTATNGGMFMYLAILLAAGAVFAFLAWKFRGYVMGIFAGALIIFAALYTRSTPIPNITVGGGIDTGIYLTLLSFGIFVALISLGKFIDSSDGRSWLEKAFGGGSDTQHVISHNGDTRRYKPDMSTMEGRAMAYRKVIHSKLNQPNKRK